MPPRPLNDQLTSNKTYTTYFPYTIYAIAAFYSLVYIFQFLSKACRQIRRHIQQAEKEHLKHAWITCVVQNRHPFLALHSSHSNPFHLSQQKQLRLLWQWSLSMGYCEYSHAARLNQLVLNLESQNKSE
ncbi:hypothetical protein A0J61_02718 [Choanephora cucurbitarum]|uniref:Transmembrane protein n=1 Tax=Choanephora cucurbitarum TaxID=101091 RepID=A0A1C7NKA3_9FUNG|nr:hypothetical protein A0J61_02718 [Choanephora cucurbitarum]